MRIKVCGMRDSQNIRELLELQPDFMGFIFYEKSPRFVGEELDVELLKSIPKSTKKVGVFVNATIDHILNTVKKYSLDYVQLHGNELPDFCKHLRRKGVNVIKAFSIDSSFNFNQVNNYKPFCDFFLFDTKGESHGGNGLVFDWDILKRYDHETPFFLAGGIDLENVEKLENLSMYAIDVNSKFELSPGMKDIEKLKILKEKMSEVLM